MSRPSEPVDTTCRSFWICDSPIFMIEPLPNCFSICCRAAVSALPLLSSIGFSWIGWSPGVSGPPRDCIPLGATLQCGKLWHRTIVRCDLSDGLTQAVEEPLQRGFDGRGADGLPVAFEVTGQRFDRTFLAGP